MNEAWESRFVDTRVEQAWKQLRLDLADKFEAALAGGGMAPTDFTADNGRSVGVEVAEGSVIVTGEDEFWTTHNVDEAAHLLCRELRETLQAVHPAFISSDLIDLADPDTTAAVLVPTHATAQSREQLQAWVEATMAEKVIGNLRVARNGDIPWSTNHGEPVVMSVRNETRVEVWTVLARGVGFRKAHKIIDDLSNKHFGLKFYLRQDTLIMSRSIVLMPFSAQALTDVLSAVTNTATKLGWVADATLSKRVKRERTEFEKMTSERDSLAAQVEKLKNDLDDAEQRAQDADRTAQRISERRRQERARANRNLARATEERDAAQADLVRLKAVLDRVLVQHEQVADRTEGGAA